MSLEGDALGDAMMTAVDAVPDKRVKRSIYRALGNALVDEIGGGSGYIPPVVYDATCSAAEAVGDVVYISGPNDVRKVDITNPATIRVAGVVIEKTAPTVCKVQPHGVLTIFSSLIAGHVYFVGTDGRPTPTLPAPPLGASIFNLTLGPALNTTTLLLVPSMLPILRR